MNHKAEYHYERDDGRPTYAAGWLTTMPPVSSHGVAVFEVVSQMRHGDPLVPGEAYGSGDLPAGGQLEIVNGLTTCGEVTPQMAAAVLRARAAGFDKVVLTD